LYVLPNNAITMTVSDCQGVLAIAHLRKLNISKTVVIK